MSLQRLEALFEERQVRRRHELTDAGINSRTVRAAVEEGLIVRPVLVRALGPLPGIFASADAPLDPDYTDALMMVVAQSGNPVIWRRTAAMRHNLGTGLGQRIDVEAGHRYGPPPPQANMELTRRRDESLMQEGVDTKPTDLGIDVRMTSPARTVVDLFRSGMGASEDSEDYRQGFAALATYISSGGEGGEIVRLARQFGPRMSTLIETATHAATESLTQGYAP